MEKRYLKYALPVNVWENLYYQDEAFWCITHALLQDGGILSTAVWTGNTNELDYGYYIILVEFERPPIPEVKLDPGFIEKGE